MADKKSGASDAALGWGILLAVFAAIFYLIWMKFEYELKSAIRWIRYGEMWVASLILGRNQTVDIPGAGTITNGEMMKIALNTPADQIEGDFLTVISLVAMQPYVWLVIVITAGLATWALFRGPGSEHRSKFDLNTLIRKQSNIFPIISPFIKFNPSTVPPRPPGADVPAELPHFAEALSPEEWVAYNEIPLVDQKLDEETATKAFSRQLGPRWRGFKHLPHYKQILLASFCLKAARKRADADTMLGRLAQCWDHEGGLKLSRDRSLLREARAVLSNQSISGKTLKKCNEHAWETTAMMRGLANAREEGGVLAPAQFVWLRSYDRALWYPLNNMGRQSLHMEAMGAMAHYKSEKLVQRPIPRPKTTDPVKSLAEYLASGKARPIPKLDYSKSKKRGVKKLKTA